MDFPKIDYSYWRQEYDKIINGINPNDRVKKSLNGIKTIILEKYQDNNDNKLATLLRNPNLEDRNMSKIKELADEIADEIFEELDNNEIKLKYLTIFDAVNSWGGISARSMYNKNVEKYQNNSTRKSWELWIDKYILAVEHIAKGNTNEVLKYLDKEDLKSKKTGIEHMGIAFASKHMWYWSDYFINKWSNNKSNKPKESKLDESYIVFDMRISKLLFSKNPNLISYTKALEKFDAIKIKLNIEREKQKIPLFNNSDIEKALFAFSQFYFSNDIDLWVFDDSKYKNLKKYYSKNEYIEIIKERIQECKIQQEKLSKGIDFEEACRIFSKTSPKMDSWMKGGEIIVKERIEKDISNVKIKNTLLKNIKKRKINIININKNECYNHIKDGLFIKSSFLNKQNKLSKLINNKISISIKGIVYYKFTGNQNSINILET